MHVIALSFDSLSDTPKRRHRFLSGQLTSTPDPDTADTELVDGVFWTEIFVIPDKVLGVAVLGG